MNFVMTEFYKGLNRKRIKLVLDFFELMKQSKIDNKVHDTSERSMADKKGEMETFGH